MKKYEFTGETKEVELFERKVTLHRIRAIADFGNVKAGDVGGWIENEENLSQEGNAWVSEDASVYGKAIVGGNAVVRGKAVVCEYASVYGNAIVSGNAVVYRNAVVGGHAEILSTSHILLIGPIGSRNDFTTFFRDNDNEITVECGCFLGKIDRFLEKVTQTHGNSKYAQVYQAAAKMAELQIE